MKLILLSDSVFSDRDYDRFGINTLLERKVEVELWCFQNIRREIIRNNTNLFEGENEKINRYIFSDYMDLERKKIDLTGVFIIDKRSGFYGKYNTCWFQLHGGIIVKLNSGLLPASDVTYLNSLKQRLLVLGNKKSLFFMVAAIKNKLRHIIAKQCNPDIVVYTGLDSNLFNSKRFIGSHAFDYDIYLSLESQKSTTVKVEVDYMVFLDNGMVSHPDYKLLSIEPYCTKDKYYRSMNNLFDMLEHKFSIPVVIAIHPRSVNISEIKEMYGGRKVFKGRSAELVRDANTVIAHDSTSINFSILWNKPLLIISTDEILKNYISYISIKNILSLLKTNSINADDFDPDMDFEILANKPIKQYQIYKEKLIKTKGTPDKNSWDIFIDELLLFYPDQSVR